DFGVARQKELDFHGKEVSSYQECGTESYFSPGKIAKKRTLATCDDVWALGVTLLYLWTGNRPWYEAKRTDDDYFQWVDEPEDHRHFSGLMENKDAFQLLKHFLEPKQHLRWSAEQAMNSELVPKQKEAKSIASRLRKTIKKHLAILADL
uniref:Protein kinase domain-containing protein n=1 Tax=Steinernema glaseri TaxID=37863 RepID=A0A1I7ZPJ8_9BILA